MTLASKLTEMANGFLSDRELIDILRHPEDFDGYTVIVEKDESGDEEGSVLRLVKVICSDGSETRFGWYEDNASTAIYALGGKTWEEYIDAWVLNNPDSVPSQIEKASLWVW